MRSCRFTPALRVVNMLGSKEEREGKRVKIMEQMVIRVSFVMPAIDCISSSVIFKCRNVLG